MNKYLTTKILPSGYAVDFESRGFKKLENTLVAN